MGTTHKLGHDQLLEYHQFGVCVKSIIKNSLSCPNVNSISVELEINPSLWHPILLALYLSFSRHAKFY